MILVLVVSELGIRQIVSCGLSRVRAEVSTRYLLSLCTDYLVCTASVHCIILSINSPRRLWALADGHNKVAKAELEFSVQ